MIIKFNCQHCKGYIRCDLSYAGKTLKCPHCYEVTQLIAPEHPETQSEPDWMHDPITEKQKAMLLLYGIQMGEGLTKGEAAELIDRAIKVGRTPTVENQTKASEQFGKIRLQEIVEQLTKAIDIIGDENVTITTLKNTKKMVKESVRSFTDIVDKRIQILQDANREIQNEKTTAWMKEHGYA